MFELSERNGFRFKIKVSIKKCLGEVSLSLYYSVICGNCLGNVLIGTKNVEKCVKCAVHSFVYTTPSILENHFYEQLYTVIITEGFLIPFAELPSAIRLDNNLSAINCSAFVRAEIERLLDLKCISQFFSDELVLNHLTVAIQKNGKKG